MIKNLYGLTYKDTDGLVTDLNPRAHCCHPIGYKVWSQNLNHAPTHAANVGHNLGMNSGDNVFIWKATDWPQGR